MGMYAKHGLTICVKYKTLQTMCIMKESTIVMLRTDDGSSKKRRQAARRVHILNDFEIQTPPAVSETTTIALPLMQCTQRGQLDSFISHQNPLGGNILFHGWLEHDSRVRFFEPEIKLRVDITTCILSIDNRGNSILPPTNDCQYCTIHNIQILEKKKLSNLLTRS
jgi:hypothetical protein